MGLRRALGTLAGGAPAPIFAVVGLGAREHVQDLRLDGRLRLVDTTSAATILLVAGAIPDDLAWQVARLHDSIPPPRATVWWPLGALSGRWLERFPHHTVVEDHLAERLKAIQRELFTGQRVSEPPVLPDEDPAPWRGVGPYGQGGTGMTGGTPYGRPMAELGPDRDGLRLDILPLRVGPFFPRFPSGLTLDMKLAGDIVIETADPTNPFVGTTDAGQVRMGLRPFIRALSEPVLVAELELARAREHLRWLADALVATELRSLGLRALRLAVSPTPPDVDSLRSLSRVLGRTQVLGWSTRNVGRVPAGELEGLGTGPVGRAAGLTDDARIEDPAYRDLGFQPIVQSAGDAAARWRQRLAEATQSLALAERAGGRRTTITGLVESPRGRLEAGSAATTRLLPRLQGLLREMEWGDAVATLVSLDLDLEEAAYAQAFTARAVAS